MPPAELSIPGTHNSKNSGPTLETYKRLVLALNEQVNLKDGTEHANKLKRKLDSDSATRLGRGIRRLVHLYYDVPNLILQADLHEVVSPADNFDDEGNFGGMDDEQVESVKRDWHRSHSALRELSRLIPNFYKKIESGDPQELDSFYRQLQKGANDARSDDVKKLKEVVANWLNSWQPPPAPLLVVDCCLQRGLQHDTTGYLICPVEYDWTDDAVRAKLRAAEEGFDLGSSFFCRFLYHGYKADLDNVEQGFLKSAMLLKTFKFIFTSPNSCKTIETQATEISDSENQPPPNKCMRAAQGKRATRRAVAATLHMDGNVTPRSIAYAAVQLHFALSSAPHWTEIHEGFDYPSFYHFIIDFFEDAGGPESQKNAQTLLQWWSLQVFPNSTARPCASTTTSKKTLRAQRNAREAQVTALQS